MICLGESEYFRYNNPEEENYEDFDEKDSESSQNNNPTAKFNTNKIKETFLKKLPKIIDSKKSEMTDKELNENGIFKL